VLYAGIAAITVLGLVRAIVLLRRRTAEIERLIAHSSPASPALASATAVHSLPVREVASSDAFILLAGIARPVVLVSSEALRRLDAKQLDAALRHEAAHSYRGDQVISAVVTFVSDIIPLPVGDLVALYRQAREFAADAHAARRADPCDLAGALLALARGASVPAGTAALAEAGTVRARLAVLLTEAPPPPSPWRRVLVAGSLAATFVLGASPAIAALVYGIQCTLPMSRMT
jgi:Zn-dependent protease with chaperone function